MRLNTWQIRSLAEQIRQCIREEFETVHLSGNLANTVSVRYWKGSFFVYIPAKTYDMALYIDKKVLAYDGKGSYASSLDKEGSWINGKHVGNHRDYVSKVILTAIDRWSKQQHLRVRIR